jgi:release factor glutamine methyltransferase
MTTIKTWLADATLTMKDAGLETARLDGLVLLEDVLGLNRAWILAHEDTKIESAKLTRLEKLLKQRTLHQPLAYIRGKSEFYGREFVISPAVLQPRPESEAFIDLLKELISDRSIVLNSPRQLHIVDVGTGCGAIGITVSLEVPNCQVELLELDQQAAAIAKINVDKFTLNLSIIISDLLTHSSDNLDILLCNLPYVPDDYKINQAAEYEPRIAIFGGPDGLILYRKLFNQVRNRTIKPLLILTESLPFQHQALQVIGQQAGYRLLKTDGLIQAFQLTGKKPSSALS